MKTHEQIVNYISSIIKYTMFFFVCKMGIHLTHYLAFSHLG